MSGSHGSDYKEYDLWDVQPHWLAEMYSDLEEQTVSIFSISHFQKIHSNTSQKTVIFTAVLKYRYFKANAKH